MVAGGWAWSPQRCGRACLGDLGSMLALSQEAMVAQELHDAAEAGDTMRVKQLLPGLGAEQAAWLRGALMRSVYENQVRVVYVLLEVSASIEAVDDLGQTPLHWAARRGFEGMARMLLNRKAAVGSRNLEGVTPLHLAVEQNFGPIVQLLLQHHADPCLAAQDGRTALHVAADCGSAVAVAVLLEAKPEGSPLMEVESSRGETALVRAAARGQAAIAQLLLRTGADTEHRNLWGQSALFLAALGGHVGSATVLLDAGASVNSAAMDGATPLHTAVDRGHTQVVELLLWHRANAAAKAKGSRTPLHTAAERGCLEAAEALLANGAEIDARAEEGRTPLSCVATRGHAAVARRLLAAGADPQALDVLKQTALHAAASAGRVEVADLLISRRVRVEQEDAAGRTPMLLALAFKQEGMVRLLLKRGGELPEDVASLPEMQPLIQEVENELLQEQLKEVESGKLKEQLVEAEQDFESARQQLLRLCTLTCTVSTATVIQHNETQLAAAREQVRATHLYERGLADHLKAAERALAEAILETKRQRQLVERLRARVEELKAGRGPQAEQLKALAREIVEAKRVDAAAVQDEARLAAQGEEARQKITALQEQLVGLISDGDQLAVELSSVRADLDKWNAQKEEAAQLHAKAHSLLNRTMPNNLLASGSRPATRSGNNA
uniref:Uncharacterized protein n=1 Tax=Pyrodinium bahamense TaxID=73915 RepID=A0A7R9ZYG5_9DINO